MPEPPRWHWSNAAHCSHSCRGTSSPDSTKGFVLYEALLENSRICTRRSSLADEAPHPHAIPEGLWQQWGHRGLCKSLQRSPSVGGRFSLSVQPVSSWRGCERRPRGATTGEYQYRRFFRLGVSQWHLGPIEGRQVLLAKQSTKKVASTIACLTS